MGSGLLLGVFPILSTIIFLPLVGALALVFLPSAKGDGASKSEAGEEEAIPAFDLPTLVALVFSLLTFVASLVLLFSFKGSETGMQFVEAIPWIPTLGVRYVVGVDGISILLVLLTTFLMPLVFIASGSVTQRKRGYLFHMLALETAMLGTLLSLDIFLFYVFWELIEEVTGARLTISYGRVGGLKDDLPDGFFERMKDAFAGTRRHLDNCDRLLTRNRIFIDRMCDIAVVDAETAMQYSLSGPIGRASGFDYDVRRDFPYSSYEDFEFESPLGSKGDNYDRFLVRFQDLYQSIRICEQVMKNLPDGEISVDDPRVVLTPKDEVYNSIDGMINHFEMVIFGVQPPKGDVYVPVEGGNGELGFYTVSDGTGRPYKVHVRAPSFIHMGIVREMLIGETIADVVPIFGMINMIGGECDR